MDFIGSAFFWMKTIIGIVDASRDEYLKPSLVEPRSGEPKAQTEFWLQLNVLYYA